VEENRTGLAIILVVIFTTIGGLIVYFFIRQDSSRLTSLTAETSADVLKVDVNRAMSRNSRTTTDVRYRYTVNNKVIDGFTRKNGDFGAVFAVNKQAKVCYNPKKPVDSEVFPLSHKCGVIRQNNTQTSSNSKAVTANSKGLLAGLPRQVGNFRLDEKSSRVDTVYRDYNPTAAVIAYYSPPEGADKILSCNVLAFDSVALSYGIIGFGLFSLLVALVSSRTTLRLIHVSAFAVGVTLILVFATLMLKLISSQ